MSITTPQAWHCGGTCVSWGNHCWRGKQNGAPSKQNSLFYLMGPHLNMKLEKNTFQRTPSWGRFWHTLRKLFFCYSAHGKGSCNDVGGTLKILPTKTSLQSPLIERTFYLKIKIEWKVPARARMLFKIDDHKRGEEILAFFIDFINFTHFSDRLDQLYPLTLYEG